MSISVRQSRQFRLGTSVETGTGGCSSIAVIIPHLAYTVKGHLPTANSKGRDTANGRQQTARGDGSATAGAAFFLGEEGVEAALPALGGVIERGDRLHGDAPSSKASP
jgi:hypothetical protein